MYLDYLFELNGGKKMFKRIFFYFIEEFGSGREDEGKFLGNSDEWNWN